MDIKNIAINDYGELYSEVIKINIYRNIFDNRNFDRSPMLLYEKAKIISEIINQGNPEISFSQSREDLVKAVFLALISHFNILWLPIFDGRDQNW